MEHNKPQELANLSLGDKEPIAETQETIISINGIIVKSKLNPAAKEFHPANVLPQYTTMCQSIEQLIQPHLEEECFNHLVEAVKTLKGKDIAIAENLVKPNDNDQTQVENRDEIQAVKNYSVLEKQDEPNEDTKDTENFITEVEMIHKELTKITIDHPGMESIQLERMQEDFMEIKKCSMNNEEMNNATKQNMSVEPTGGCQEGEGLTIISKNISEAQKECTGKVMIMSVETESDVEHITTAELQEVIDLGENGQQESDMEINFIMQTNKLGHNQNTFKLDIVCNIPPNRSTEELPEKTVELVDDTETKVVTKKVLEENKRKNFGIGKLAKMALCTNSKSSSQDKSEKKPALSRTKRISESLHNLASSLKSKTGTKKPECSLRLLPRSSTIIPRTTVRSCALINKSKDGSGLSKDLKKTTKDVKSLQSSSSAEMSVSSETSEQSTSTLKDKPLNKKTYTVSNKAPANSLSATMGSKFKETKLPRSTLASTLRQNEAQKRRNLFPIDDTKPNTNVDLSDFLFK